MDGTLVDSTAGVVGAWNTFAEAYPGIDVHHILNSTSLSLPRTLLGP
jgi:glycerol 3-phosphatase-1